METHYQHFILIGLALDIIGIILLFFRGYPQRLPDLDSYSEISVSEKGKLKLRKQRNWAIFGLFLVVIGFVFQIYGTLCSF